MCSGLANTSLAVYNLANAGAIGVFVLRTYAIYGKNLPILIGLGSLWAIRVLLTYIWAYLKTTYISVPESVPAAFLGTCSSVQPLFDQQLNIAESALALLFDTSVLVLTIWRTFRIARDSMKTGISDSLSVVVIRDGLLYYLCSEILIVAGICVEFIPSTTLYLVSIVGSFQNVLSAILINHLILNLRRIANDNDSQQGSVSQAVFAMDKVLGNIGAPLHDGYDDLVFHDEEVETFQGEDIQKGKATRNHDEDRHDAAQELA